jgi:hypothetical protein
MAKIRQNISLPELSDLTIFSSNKFQQIPMISVSVHCKRLKNAKFVKLLQA